MTRATTFDVLLALSATREQAAIAQVATAERAVAAASDRLQQLREYRAGYGAVVRREAGATSAAELRSHHRFVAGLSQAIDQAEQNLLASRSKLTLERASLAAANRKRELLAGMVGRLRLRERSRRTNREQRLADELAARRSRTAS